MNKIETVQYVSDVFMDGKKVVDVKDTGRIIEVAITFEDGTMRRTNGKFANDILSAEDT
jgi:hypothetical protein